jgi:predicted signal transduction protein with EAL and GGDEF domain
VVAEGVESARQLELLRSLGCDQVQGFLLAHPLPPDALAAMLAERLRADAPSPHAHGLRQRSERCRVRPQDPARR